MLLSVQYVLLRTRGREPQVPYTSCNRTAFAMLRQVKWSRRNEAEFETYWTGIVLASLVMAFWLVARVAMTRSTNEPGKGLRLELQRHFGRA